MEKKCIISFGMPASGKSSILLELVNIMPNYKFICVDDVLEENSELNILIKKLFIESHYDLFFEFQTKILRLRHSHYMDAQELSLIDESILNTLIYSKSLYELGWLSKQDYLTNLNQFNVFLKQMQKPLYVIYTHCELYEIKKRIKIRNRYHEKFYTDEYLLSLFNNSEKIAEEYKNEFRFVKYDTTNYSPKEIAVSFFRNYFL